MTIMESMLVDEVTVTAAAADTASTSKLSRALLEATMTSRDRGRTNTVVTNARNMATHIKLKMNTQFFVTNVIKYMLQISGGW